MSTWRVARGLEQLRRQLDERSPQRSRASDGSIGDPAHVSRGRTSDHNPRRFPWADRPLVLARDFTHDPAGGLDCQQLYRELLVTRDRRIAYLIWRRQITSGAGGPQPWIARRYNGANPHDKHLHLSVVADARADTAIPWLLGRRPSPTARRPTLRRGDTGAAVELVQRYLGTARPGTPGYGTFGPQTEQAVRAYQAMRGIAVDGVVGPRTWAEMGL